MPFASAEKQREYQRKWLAARRRCWFAGKACAFCSSSANLQLDHIDQKKKVSHTVWSWSEAKRKKELKKCRVLCRDCHIERTKLQQNNKSNNRHLTFRGIRLTVAQWSRRIGLKQCTALPRWRYGWSVKDTLTVPLRKLSRRQA